MAQQTDPRILGTEPIGKLLLQYSIPAIIGMTITSLYNIIDSIFIGHGVGPMAISGLAITFPLMNLVVAFCVLISHPYAWDKKTSRVRPMFWEIH